MTLAEIKFYELLKARIGEKEAQACVEGLDATVERKIDERISKLATKEELLATNKELQATNKELQATREDLHKFRLETKDEFGKVRLEMNGLELRLQRNIYGSTLIQLVVIIGSVVSLIFTLRK